MKKVLFIIVALVLVSSCKKSDSEFLFSVSETEKVVFSKGNLQYQASTDTWRFAKYPWDCVGSGNENISPSYSGWIDLFGWGTGINPTQHSENDEDYSLFYDWGDYCGLPLPTGATGKWRTLTKDEWNYVMFERSTTSGVRYAKAKVNNINGIVIVPDSWTTATYGLNNANDREEDYDSNIISATEWTSVLEPAGCAFLPAAGSRFGSDVNYFGLYWSSTPDGSGLAYCLGFYNIGFVECSVYDTFRVGGFSVRLVADVK